MSLQIVAIVVNCIYSCYLQLFLYLFIFIHKINLFECCIPAYCVFIHLFVFYSVLIENIIYSNVL